MSNRVRTTWHVALSAYLEDGSIASGLAKSILTSVRAAAEYDAALVHIVVLVILYNVDRLAKTRLVAGKPHFISAEEVAAVAVLSMKAYIDEELCWVEERTIGEMRKNHIIVSPTCVVNIRVNTLEQEITTTIEARTVPTINVLKELGQVVHVTRADARVYRMCEEAILTLNIKCMKSHDDYMKTYEKTRERQKKQKLWSVSRCSR
jgi:hypothetical protein